MTADRRTAILVAAITIVAAALRAIRLDSGLWYDEIVTLVDFARLPLVELISSYPHNNTHPLYSLLAYLSINLFGEHAWSLRLPGYLFGVASIPMLYGLGLTLTSRREALWSAAFLAVSYHHVWFSQNARGYTALGFWTMLATLLLLRGLERDEAKTWVGYAAAAALGVYTHLTMVFVVAAHVLVCACLAVMRDRTKLQPTKRTWFIGFGLATFCGAVMYAPMMVAIFRFFTAPAVEAAQVATAGWAVREAVLGLVLGLSGIGLLVAAVVSLGGTWSYLRQSPTVLALMFLPGLLTGLTVVALRQPIRPRFFFMFAGFGVLIIVRGAMVTADWIAARVGGRVSPQASNWRPGDAVVALMVLVSVFSLGAVYRYPKQDFEGALEFVERARATNEPVVTAGPASFPYQRFYETRWQTVETAEQFRLLLAQSPRVWFVYTLADYIEPALMQLVRESCPTVREFPGTVAGGEIVVCAAPPPESPGGDS